MKFKIEFEVDQRIVDELEKKAHKESQGNTSDIEVFEYRVCRLLEEHYGHRYVSNFKITPHVETENHYMKRGN